MAGTYARLPEPLRLGQQVFDRGGVPSCAPAWRAFAHGFELCGDLLERTIGCCRLDAGNQSDQPVVAGLRTGAVEQCTRDDPLGGQTLNRAAEALYRPMASIVLVEDPDEITPGLVRAHPPHRRQP
jgi:hypothetical protein